jgi:FkbM family methyltransferase
MNIVVEIGANTGEDTKNLIKEADHIYVCEPDPVLFSKLVEKYQDEHKVTLWPFAIDYSDNARVLHISHGERGINSLHDLHPNLLTTPLQKHKVYQEGFQENVMAWTARLDSLMALYRIPHINYLWIDAQGNDLVALESLGDRVKDVLAGRCECTFKVPIYNVVDNSHESVVKFLEAHGFKHDVDYVHADDSEIDVKFWR